MNKYFIKNIKRITDKEVFSRGEAIAKSSEKIQDREITIEEGNTIVKAIVRGTEDYQTKISWNSEGNYSFRHSRCNCPYDWGPICKHQIALAVYTWREYQQLQKEEKYHLEFTRFRNGAMAFQIKNEQGMLHRFIPHRKEMVFPNEICTQIYEQLLSVEENNGYFRGSEEVLLSPENSEYLLFLHDEKKQKIFGAPPFENIKYEEESAANKEESSLFALTVTSDMSTGKALMKLFHPGYSWMIGGGNEVLNLYHHNNNKNTICKQWSMSSEDLASPINGFSCSIVESMIFEYNTCTLPIGHVEELLKHEGKEVLQRMGFYLDLSFFEKIPLHPNEKAEVHAYIRKEQPQYRYEKPRINIRFFLQWKRKKIDINKYWYEFLKQEEFEDGIPEELNASKSKMFVSRLEPIENTEENFRYYVFFPATAKTPAAEVPINLTQLQAIFDWSEEYPDDIYRYAEGFEVSYENQCLPEIGRWFHQQAEQHDWKLHFNKNMPSLDFQKQSIKFDFDIEVNENQLLEFDLKSSLKELNITEAELKQLIEDSEEYTQIGKEFIAIDNKDQVKKLLEWKEKNNQAKQKKSSKIQIPLWMVGELEYLMSREKNFKAHRQKSYQKFYKEAKKGKLVKNIKIPESLKILRTYQKEGLEWMHFLRNYGFGGILADDMGLGKTLQTLAFIKSLKKHKKAQPHFIICPKILIFNWQAEVEKFTPDLNVKIISGTKKERQKKISEIRENPEKYDVVLSSYTLVQQDLDVWLEGGMVFDTIFLDEAQYIKNHKAKRARSIKLLPAQNRIALTGTPIENSLSELWSIFDFLMPGFLGNYESFRSEYENPIKKGEKSLLKHLTKKVQPFLLRRTKEEKLSELPDKIEQNSYASLSKEQLTLYTSVLASVKSEVFEKVNTDGIEKSQIIILAALTKLRQICNHPSHIDENFIDSASGKVELLLELLSEMKESRKKVLIFSSFVKTLKYLSSKLDQEEISYAYLDGQTQNREEVINNFKENPDFQAFLISIKSGGTGLNLTEAENVIIFDPWWNPMVEMQAVDRVHRMGQKEVVNVHRFITKGTLEEKMLKIKERKKSLFDKIVGQDDQAIKSLSWDDLQELFTLEVPKN